VAVLPFRNAGPSEDDYLAEELADDLTDTLSTTRGLKVRARGAVRRACGGGDERDPGEVGRALGVQFVVEGSVRRARGRVRISVQLIGVVEGFNLWSKRFDCAEGEVLCINDEAVRGIVDSLALVYDGPARQALTDPAAVDLYIRAKHEYRKLWPNNQRRAIELFEQAVSLAPDDPGILSGLAMSLARLAFFAGDGGVDRAREIADRALALAPEQSEAHFARGSVLLHLGETRSAVQEISAALRYNPGLTEAHAALGRLLVEVGAVEQGCRKLEAALAQDPTVPLACAALVRAYELLGQRDRADAMFPQLRETEGAFSHAVTLIRFSMWRGQPELVDKYVGEFLAGASEMKMPAALLDIARQLRGSEVRPDLAVLAGMTGGARQRVYFLQLQAEVVAFLGKVEDVFEALRYACDCGLSDRIWLERCPLFDSLRKDRRFEAIVGQVRQRTDDVLHVFREANTPSVFAV
jgi:serine/threonine-protein kinase